MRLSAGFAATLITATIVAAATASSAHASVIVTDCGRGGLCAISPEGGPPRTLLRLPSEYRLSAISVSADGKTFLTSFSGTPVGSRLVTGPTDLKTPVTSTTDTATLHDLRPPIPITYNYRYYSGGVFAPDASNVVYSVSDSLGTDGSYPTTVKLASGSVDRLLAQGDSYAGPARFAGRPAYTTGQTSACALLPDGGCRSLAPGYGFSSGSPDGRYLLTVERKPSGYTMSLRDTTTLRVIRTYPDSPGGAFSPDPRFISYTRTPASGEEESVFVAPVDGSAPPRLVGDGSTVDWGGSMGSATSIAGAAAPKLAAPKRVSRRFVAKGVKLRVRAQKGIALRASLKVGRRVVATKRAVAGSRTKALRLKPSRKARKRLRGAKKLKATVKVGRTFTLTRTIRVR